ncbi:endolytic transglycosylase MltG [Occultella glacieicola]|uniref:Endolytic murein transglycosylase n=1 Tax=Occultella glacieicola TaxID=2518684 RepID=A0ABY2E4X9_9MICO|nr:endolytic transglycosylase MltG [Occultella glacieicola]TDE92482.1 endolytic transglycosylase MltG [Occultella glacieicola]
MTDLFDEAFTGSAAPEPQRATSRRNSQRRREAKRRAQRRRNMITFFVMIVSIALLVGGAWVLIRPMISGDGAPSATVSDYPGPGTGEVQIVVNTGETGADIATTLVDNDVVATTGAFVQAYNTNPDAVSIQAGTYTLQSQMNAADAVAALLDPASRSDLTITIPEGWRATKIYARIANRLGITEEEVATAAAEVAASYLPAEAGGEIEGWLFASTYTIQTDSTATSVLQQMVDLTVANLDERNIAAEDREELLIKASIVEAEVANQDDWNMVARVVENRLAGCTGDGTLGMDSTYAYGLNKIAPEITRTEWETEHPFNTRIVPGLPPTPIGAPGAGALDAVLNPPEGDWCYFVTVNPTTGETRFTADYDEHLENQRLYREWLAEQTAAPEETTEGEG